MIKNKSTLFRDRDNIDLLFYHLKLKCYIVVELKAREFEPTDAGQLNFYLSAVDDLVKYNKKRRCIIQCVEFKNGFQNLK